MKILRILAAVAVLAALSFFAVACGGGSTTTGPSEFPSPVGSIERQGNFFVITIEGARRSDFLVQLWDKGKYGTDRPADGTPVFEQKGLSNGVVKVDATQWACLDLQVDLGSPNGGILIARQFAAWGTCPKPPTPRPTPQPTPTPSPSPTPDPGPTCDNGEYRVQAWENNKNRIKANVHVSGAGVWEVKLFATSQLNEFPYNPDFTKDTDSVLIPCKGQGELKVEYDWKGHSSAYWWFILYRGGVPVYIEPYVTHGD